VCFSLLACYGHKKGKKDEEEEEEEARLTGNSKIDEKEKVMKE